MEKRCIRCKKDLDVSYFYKDKTRKDGYDNKCKKCDYKHNRIKYNENRELKKMKYPLGTVLTEQYTNGGRFHLNNKPYVGWFHLINGEFFTGKQPGSFSKKLIQFQKEFPNQQKEAKPLKINKGYYIKKVNEGFARSVGVNEYEKYKNNPLYKTVEVNKDDVDDIFRAKQLIPEINYYFQ